MAEALIYTNSIPLRDSSDDSKITSGRYWLLPEGGSAPGDLIELTQDATFNWYWNFPVEITNGNYTLYSGSPGSQIEVTGGNVRVIRDGIVTAADTDFAY